MVNLRGLALYRLNLFHRVNFTTRQQSAKLHTTVAAAALAAIRVNSQLAVKFLSLIIWRPVENAMNYVD